MIVVLAILGVLAAAGRPLLELTLRREREFALRDDLRRIRSAIDDYEQAVARGDLPRPKDAPPQLPVYPPSLRVLVDGVSTGDAPDSPRRYFLRRLPRDPFADPELTPEASWGLRSSDSPPDAPKAGRDVFDVYSRSEGVGLDGTPYRNW